MKSKTFITLQSQLTILFHLIYYGSGGAPLINYYLLLFKVMKFISAIPNSSLFNQDFQHDSIIFRFIFFNWFLRTFLRVLTMMPGLNDVILKKIKIFQQKQYLSSLCLASGYSQVKISHSHIQKYFVCYVISAMNVD